MRHAHLDRVRLEALLDGRLPEAEAETALEHLDGCPECAAFLESDDAASALDAQVEQLTGALDGASGLSGDELRTTRHAVLAQAPTASQRQWGGWLRRLAMPAVAAVGVALVVLVLSSEPAPRRPAGVTWDGVKGSPAEGAPQVWLDVLVQSPDQPDHGVVGRRGADYGPDAQLVLRTTLTAQGFLALARVSEAAGQVEWLVQPERGAAAPRQRGSHYLRQGGEVLAYSLDGLRGRQTFVALASPTPLPTAPALEDALRALAATSSPAEGAAERLRAEGVDLDVFPIRVEAGDE